MVIGRRDAVAPRRVFVTAVIVLRTLRSPYDISTKKRREAASTGSHGQRKDIDCINLVKKAGPESGAACRIEATLFVAYQVRADRRRRLSGDRFASTATTDRQLYCKMTYSQRDGWAR